MNTQEAHQIANPTILEILEDLKHIKESQADTWAVEYVNPILKGILIAQEKEIEFLTSEFFIYLGIDNKYQTIKVRKRLEALKLSCQDLRRVLK